MAINSRFVVGDARLPFSIVCNTSGVDPSLAVKWLQSVNKTGVYDVSSDSRISINGSTLSFSQLTLIDEEYYGCGVIDPNSNKLKLLNTYFLYVRGKMKQNLCFGLVTELLFIISFVVIPTLSLIVNNNTILSNQTISLINSNNNMYILSCIAISSKPDVDLSMFDINTQLNLANGLKNQTTGYCDSNNLCTKVLQVNFQFTDSRFTNLSSITCLAKSNNIAVNLTASIQRNVTVISLISTTTTTPTVSTTSKLNYTFFYLFYFNFISYIY